MLLFKITVYKRKILQWQPLIWRCRSRIYTSKIRPIYLLYIICNYCLILLSLFATSLCSASYLGCQRDSARICCWAPCCDASAPERTCSWYATQDSQQQTRRPPLLLSVDWTDRRTDGRPLQRPRHHASNVKKRIISCSSEKLRKSGNDMTKKPTKIKVSENRHFFIEDRSRFGRTQHNYVVRTYLGRSWRWQCNVIGDGSWSARYHALTVQQFACMHRYACKPQEPQAATQLNT